MKSYYYVSPQGKQVGPIPMDQLLKCGVTRKTLVWCEGMTNWREAEKVPELHALIAQIPPQNIPPQPPPQSSNYASASNIQPPKPDTYMVWAILTTILCCLPFGIVSIVYAAKVDSLYYAEHYAEAINASNKAKNWAIASGCTALAIWVIYIIIIAIAAETTRPYYW